MGMMLVRHRQQLEAEAARRTDADGGQKRTEQEESEVKKPVERRTTRRKN